MEDCDDQGEVAGPVVETEIVEAAVGPVADGAVAEGHHSAEEDVEGDGGYGGEAEVGGEIEDRDIHCESPRGKTREQVDHYPVKLGIEYEETMPGTCRVRKFKVQ